MSRNRKNNHYHYAEKFSDRRRRFRVRDIFRLPKKSVIFAMLVLFAFGLISTTFAAYVTTGYDNVIDRTSEEKGIVMSIRNKKVQDDTLASSKNDLAATGAANYTFYFAPPKSFYDAGSKSFRVNIKNTNGSAEEWKQSGDMTNTGRTYKGRPVFKVTMSLNYSKLYNLQYQGYDGTTQKKNDEVYAGSATNVTDYSGKVYDGSGHDTLTYDTFKLYSGTNSTATSNTNLGSFTYSSGSTYTLDVSLTGGTTYNLFVYNSAAGFSSKTYRCDNSTVYTDTHEENMYQYNDNIADRVLKFMPTYSATYTITWTLAQGVTVGEQIVDSYVRYGSLKATIPDFKVLTYNMNGHGTQIADQVVQSGTFTKPTDPSAPGYTFGGWYTNSGCTTAYNWSTTASTCTIYAKWTEITKTITINTNGGGTVATSNSSSEPSSGYAASKTATVGISTSKYVFAKPNTGFTFSSWSRTGSAVFSNSAPLSSGAQRVLLKTNGSDTAGTLTANFTLNAPTVSSYSYPAYTFTGVAIDPTISATSATGNNSNISYTYSLPSGTTGATVNSSNGHFTATESGTYTVSVYATDTQGTFTANSSVWQFTINVIPAPEFTLTPASTNGTTFDGHGTAVDPYIFVINQPLNISATLTNRDSRFTYQWSADQTDPRTYVTAMEDILDENNNPTGEQQESDTYKITNVNESTSRPTDHVNTTVGVSSNQTFTIYCKAYLTADSSIELVVPKSFEYQVSNQILSIDDCFFMEDKGTGTYYKYPTSKQMIYREGSAALATDVTYGGSTFNTTVSFSKDLFNFSDIFTSANTGILNQFFNFEAGHENDAINDVYKKTTSPGVKAFKVKYEDVRNGATVLSKISEIIQTVVGTRQISGSKSVYFCTNSDLSNVRNIVLFYRDENGDWQFQNGQQVVLSSTGKQYRFNIPSSVTTVYYGAAKKSVSSGSDTFDIYGLPTFPNSNALSWDSSYADYFVAMSNAVNLQDGKPKCTANINSGNHTITGTLSAL